MFGLFPYITIYLQTILGYSPFEGGLRMLPIMSLIFIMPLVTRRAVSRRPAGKVLGVGLVLGGVGLLLMEVVSSTSHWTVLLPGMIVIGLGVGLANPAIAHIALALVAPARSGMASGISNTCRIGGLACGVAGLGAVLQSGIQSKLEAIAPGSGRATAEAVAAAGVRAPGVSPADATVAFVSGLHLIFVVGAALLFVGAIAAFALIRSLNVQPAPAPAEPSLAD